MPPILYPFQRELLVNVAKEFKYNDRVMMQSPTGSGKSVMLAKFATFVPGDIYWIVHRDVLQQQGENHLLEFDIWHGEVTSAMRFRNRVMSGEYNPTSKDIMIIDEAHHSASKTVRDIIRGNESIGLPPFPGKILGATATPWRMSRKEGFTELFDSLVCGPQVSKLVDQGFLARPEVLLPDDDSLIIRGGGNSGELDYTVSGTWEANSYQIMVEHACSWLVRQGGRAKRALIYANGNNHAKKLHHELATKYGRKGLIVNADSDWDDRVSAQLLLARGDISYIINVEIYTEGYDLRTCDCVVLARPTLSLALYLQMIGRSMRPYEGKVPVILDCCGLSMVHGMPTLNRAWSLDARGGNRQGMTPTKKCPRCGGRSHTATKICRRCQYEFFYVCPRCSKPVSSGESCQRCANNTPPANGMLPKITRGRGLPVWDEGEGVPVLVNAYNDVFVWSYPSSDHRPPPLIEGQVVIAQNYRGERMGRYVITGRMTSTRYRCEPEAIEGSYEIESSSTSVTTIDHG